MRNTTLLLSTVAFALAISFSAVKPANATLIPVVAAASNNSTVQVPGPRTGTNGKNFFNLEGSGVSSPATNSSFGVIDFNFATLNLGGTATSVGGGLLQLTEANQAFTAPGNLSIYVSTQTGVSIEPANTTLNYVNGSNGTASVDTDLGTLTQVGTGTFNTTGAVNNGQLDLYNLSFTGAGLTAILNAINNHRRCVWYSRQIPQRRLRLGLDSPTLPWLDRPLVSLLLFRRFQNQRALHCSVLAAWLWLAAASSASRSKRFG